MNWEDWSLVVRPVYPWSLPGYGLVAWGVLAALLVAITLWTYAGHPQLSRRRLLLLLSLRLAALTVALLTAIRPALSVQEQPQVPSVLLVGIDVSESMTVRDEANSQSRIEAVRRMLDKTRPLWEQLVREQNVQVYFYAVGSPDFDPSTSLYTPGLAADEKRSDYGSYLHRTYERWQAERFIRGHWLIGDGADNGQRYSAITEAARWARRGVPLTTFTVGEESTRSDSRDIVVTTIQCDPTPAPIKTEVTATATIHAFGFAGTRVVARLFLDDKPAVTDEFLLTQEKENKIRLTFKAPDKPGEVKIRLVVGQEREGQIIPLSGESSGDNNASETYLTVTKDGVRLLLVDRLRWETTLLLDALRSDKRFDVNVVLRQTTELPATPQERQFLDLEANAYDVVLIGNVRGGELRQIDPAFFDKLRERVLRHGLGVMFLGGEHAYYDLPDDLLPVIPAPGQLVEVVDRTTQRPLELYQMVPTEIGLDTMCRLARERSESITLWNMLNGRRSRAKLTGYNRLVRKPTGTIYAWAAPQIEPTQAGSPMPDNRHPLLVGHQIGDANRGRVLAFAAYDTYLWTSLGQPKTRQGLEIHHRFWKQCVLWLAHQEEEEGQAYVRPALRQLKTGQEQTLRVGVKKPGGQDDPEAEFTVKIVPLAPGQKEPTPEQLEQAPPEIILRDAEGARVLHRPRLPGEYYAWLTSPKKDDKGQPLRDAQGRPVLLQAAARYVVLPDVSEEMLRVNADHDFMKRLSQAFGGKALRLEDLPQALRELHQHPLAFTQSKPRYYPDWRRDQSRGFLPLWLVLFTLFLVGEWGLRRLWGLV
ncbi:MAG: hypothetical protein NZU63_03910 [Gemmataceae bacterium]|nr:hypothetical protein [Gemmataceae bacterium]MDW8243197.1 hypothetical protein [Thermogemmata sp.]